LSTVWCCDGFVVLQWRWCDGHDGGYWHGWLCWDTSPGAITGRTARARQAALPGVVLNLVREGSFPKTVAFTS
jgi:hypothetical protein